MLLELHYSDPRDSKLYTEPGADPLAASNDDDADGIVYRLFKPGPDGTGGEYYYCRPYKPQLYYQRMRQRGTYA